MATNSGASEPAPTQEPDAEPGTGWDLGFLPAAVGLLAALSTIVYISGGALLIVRFKAKDLPVEAVVASLPRQLLISIGLTEVVLPLALVIAGAFAVLYALLIPGVERLGNPLEDWQRATPAQQTAFVAFALSVAAGGAALTALVFGTDPRTVGAALATVVTFFVFGRVIRRRERGRPRSFAAIAWTAVLAAVCLTPWFVALAERRQELLRVRVCTIDGRQRDGVLIADTTERVYLGEDRAATNERPHIAVIPSARVQQVFIGGQGTCDPSPARG